ncbi:MAG: diguanylate cyclase [Arenimonas sp.]
MIGQTSRQLLIGLCVSLFVIAGIVFTNANIGRLDSPPPALAVPVIIAAYWGSTRGGLVCALLLFAYSMFTWMLPGDAFRFSTETQVRLTVLAVALPFAAILVGYLKNKSDNNFAALQVSEGKYRALHEELQTTANALDRILDQSMDVVCTVNAAGQFTMVSAASKRVWGYLPSELVGRKYMELVHPEDYERTTLVASKIISGLHTVDFINRYIRKDGSVLHVSWSSRWSSEDQLMYAIARDYTEQKKVDDERARYVAIIEATSDLVGMSWSDGRVSYINRAGREMLGIGLEEDISSIELDDIYTDWAADVLTGNAVTTSLDHGVWIGESALQPRTGEAIPVSQIVLAHRRPEGQVEFMSTIAKDITTIKALEAKLRLEASTDELSGLFNRRHFMERLRASMHSARRRGFQLSFAICDLDGFKQINDQYGHQVGDKVLKAVAAILLEEIRGEDVVGRYGGDEFCMMFSHVSAAEAISCLERIRQQVSQLTFTVGEALFSLTMTFGIADYDHSDETEERLIETADQALYVAKTAGKNRIEIALS